ncbi:hypothetical protein FGU65_05315 [Methanoculleus sp. FWC-SCC1]|uniref:Uncharacterized protein n=1 Tax=Methanoculleus frigidifontis TaxID=2584085 RepID=A0ABT8M8S4_9EURY|nr:hypothetical protein [Methanoculleus sp. FWC-SCC1]MDN7024316.1 hypothetical protein [Methanoculleus sp. FWC-SCC1]
MKRVLLLLPALLAAALICAPASAFTANALDISVNETGDAEVTFDYSLSWFEQIAVFFQIAQPDRELKNALESYSGKQVDVVGVETGSAVFAVRDFARIKETANGTVYTLPGLDFTAAEEKLKSYWFAPLVEADFSPAVTTIRFPDGHEEKVFNESAIPSASHTIA